MRYGINGPFDLIAGRYNTTLMLKQCAFVLQVSNPTNLQCLADTHFSGTYKGTYTAQNNNNDLKGENLTAVRAQAFAEATGGKGLIICISVWLASVADTTTLARYILANNINVLVFELENEPWNQGLPWSNATGYAVAARPYSNAIKAVSSQFKVSVFGSPPPAHQVSNGCDLNAYSCNANCADAQCMLTVTNWKADMIAYEKANGAFWDYVSIHMYLNDLYNTQYIPSYQFPTTYPVSNGDYTATYVAGVASYLNQVSTLKWFNYQLYTKKPLIVSEFGVSGVGPNDVIADVFTGLINAQFALQAIQSNNVVAAVLWGPLLNVQYNITMANAVIGKLQNGDAVDTDTTPLDFYPSAALQAIGLVGIATQNATSWLQTTVTDTSLYVLATQSTSHTWLVIVNLYNTAHTATVVGMAPRSTLTVSSPNPRAANNGTSAGVTYGPGDAFFVTSGRTGAFVGRVAGVPQGQDVVVPAYSIVLVLS